MTGIETYLPDSFRPVDAWVCARCFYINAWFRPYCLGCQKSPPPAAGGPLTKEK